MRLVSDRLINSPRRSWVVARFCPVPVPVPDEAGAGCVRGSWLATGQPGLRKRSGSGSGPGLFFIKTRKAITEIDMHLRAPLAGYAKSI